MKRFTDYIKESLLDNEGDIINKQLSLDLLSANNFKNKLKAVKYLLLSEGGEYVNNKLSIEDEYVITCLWITSDIYRIRFYIKKYNISVLFVYDDNENILNKLSYFLTQDNPMTWRLPDNNTENNWCIINKETDNIVKFIDNIFYTVKDKVYHNESLLEPEEDIVNKRCCYKVGSYYNDGKIKGIVASIKEDGLPHLIIALHDYNDDVMTWNKAMRCNRKQKNGWHIPSKEELEEVWHNDPKVTDILNKAIEKYNGTKLNRCYWSSSEFGESIAWRVDSSNGYVYGSIKDNDFYVRPFVALS